MWQCENCGSDNIAMKLTEVSEGIMADSFRCLDCGYLNIDDISDDTGPGFFSLSPVAGFIAYYAPTDSVLIMTMDGKISGYGAIEGKDTLKSYVENHLMKLDTLSEIRWYDYEDGTVLVLNSRAIGSLSGVFGLDTFREGQNEYSKN